MPVKGKNKQRSTSVSCRLALVLSLIMLPNCRTIRDEDGADLLDVPAVSDCKDLLARSEPKPEVAPQGVASEMAGTAASVTLSTIGYVGDAAVVIFGGIGVGVIICSPVIAIEGIAKSSGKASGDCVGSVINGLKPISKIGSGIYENTQDWRDHRMTEIARQLRHMAYCHEQQNVRESLVKANSFLELALSGSDFKGHVAQLEVVRLRSATKRVSNKIFRLDNPDTETISENNEKQEIDAATVADDADSAITASTSATPAPIRPDLVANDSTMGNRWLLVSGGLKMVWMLSSQKKSEPSAANNFCENYADTWGEDWKIPDHNVLRLAISLGIANAEKNSAFGALINNTDSFVWLKVPTIQQRLIVNGTIKPIDFYKPMPANPLAMPLCYIELQ